MKNSSRGFTLIEMMIAAAIIAILAAVAIPAYNSYMVKARRADAVGGLQLAATRLEQYYFQYNAYTENVNLIGGSGGTLKSPEGYYTISVEVPDTDTNAFTLTASPAGVQSKDTECTSFTLDEKGARGSTPSGSTAKCWSRR